MRFNKWTLGLGAVIAAAICMVAQPAKAQFGFDTFRGLTPLTISAPQPWLTTAAINTVTNGPVDILGYDGIGSLYLFAATNSGGTLTAQVYTSPDSTNWTALANFGYINSQTAVNITNLTFGSTNLIVTDNYLLPYLPTTPTAATAGFATPYPNYNSGILAYTNTGAITLSAKGITVVGFNLRDCNRYVYVIWTGTGAVTNGQTDIGSMLLGQRLYPAK